MNRLAPSPHPQTPLLLALLWLILAGSPPLTAQEASPTPTPLPSTGQTSPPSPTGNNSAAQEEKTDSTADPCRISSGLDDDFIDRVRRGLYTSVCASSRWFDTFFGDARAHDENSSTYGSLSLGLKWTQYDQFEPIFKGRVSFSLPNADRKFKVFIGRVDPDQYVQDSESFEGNAIPVHSRNDEESWMLGLGFTPLRSRTQRISFQLGLRAALPLDPYAKTQYRWFSEMGSKTLFRFRQTLFWYRRKGYGTTTNLDLEHRLKASTLLRASARATIYEESQGVEWRDSLIAFHQFTGARAIGCRLWVEGKSDAEVPVSEYGAWLFFRRRIHRRWLYTDIGAGVSWPRETLLETREASWGLSFGIQIQFGEEVINSP